MAAGGASEPPQPLRTDASPAAARLLLGVASASVAVVVWGAGSVLVKQIDATGVAVAFHRLWIGAALTAVVFLSLGGRITRRLLRLSLPGGLFFAADVALFFSALRATSVANATIIGALQPVLLLAVAPRLFGERTRLADVFLGAIAIAGAAVVVLGGDAGGAASRWGDLLAVGALVCWTGYFITSKQARTELSSFEYLTGLTLVAAVAIVPLPLLLDQPLAVGDARSWGMLVFVAVVNGALGHFLMNWSHAHVPIVVLSLLTLGIPVAAASSAALFIAEPLNPLQMAGMAAVLSSLGLVAVGGARRRPAQQRQELAAEERVPEP